MAQSPADPSHSLLPPGLTATFQPAQASVPMEPSISSSSISSSTASFPSSSFSSSSTASAIQPMTPQRLPNAFHPASAMTAFASDASSSKATLDNGNSNSNDSDSITMPSGVKKPLDISNLMSPPEPDQLDSFSVNDAASHHSRSSTPGLGMPKADIPKNGPLSPPISPKDRKSSAVSTDLPATAARDPILYPPTNDASTSTQSRPLFAAASRARPVSNGDAALALAAGVVNEHVAARSPTLFRRASPPRGEDYELALYLKSEVMKRYNMDRRGWLRKEREQLLADRKAAADRNRRLHLAVPAARPSPTVLQAPVSRPAKPQHSPSQQPSHQSTQRQNQPHQSGHSNQPRSSPLQPVLDNNNRVAKRSRATPQSRTSLPARIAPQVNGPARQPGSHTRVSRGSPEPRVRTAAPNREDKDFMSLPDFCPPLSTLPERTNNLKVDWKGNALDLSRDPYLHLLHRDEVGLAASLRLDCATYLTSKRRIFIRRLECARIGKEFRKTDAQQACKIDVNKASKLWTAYEKVGWLRLEHMQRFF